MWAEVVLDGNAAGWVVGSVGVITAIVSGAVTLNKLMDWRKQERRIDHLEAYADGLASERNRCREQLLKVYGWADRVSDLHPGTLPRLERPDPAEEEFEERSLQQRANLLKRRGHGGTADAPSDS